MSIRVIQGDCRAVLATLPANSVHCVVTSPPYWGLRDYGIAPMVWGGDGSCNESDPQWYRCEDCNITKHISELTSGCPKCGQTMVPASGHVWGEETIQPRHGDDGVTGSTLQGGKGTQAQARRSPIVHAFCHCGAWRGAHGLEPTIDLYVRNAVEIFRAVHRVLRPDGTLWLNLGDTYAGGGNGGSGSFEHHRAGWRQVPARSGQRNSVGGLKPKDLCGIPWRVAFALQADGWWLRQDIIWSKPNPMPESVTDRCTKAHEYLFLLTKSARYFFDAEAIKEAQSEGTYERFGNGNAPRQINAKSKTAVPGEVLANSEYKARTPDAILPDGKRNKRSVWTVATSPFPEAHFATFPPELIEPCIKAGTSEKGCCAKCGAPWERQTEQGQSTGVDGKSDNSAVTLRNDALRHSGRVGERSSRTLGWRPTCKCAGAVVPCTVLDPFGGAGTTGLMADRLQRNAILIELNPIYAEMAKKRIFSDAPLFAGAAE